MPLRMNQDAQLEKDNSNLDEQLALRTRLVPTLIRIFRMYFFSVHEVTITQTSWRGESTTSEASVEIGRYATPSSLFWVVRKLCINATPLIMMLCSGNFGMECGTLLRIEVFTWHMSRLHREWRTHYVVNLICYRLSHDRQNSYAVHDFSSPAFSVQVVPQFGLRSPTRFV